MNKTDKTNKEVTLNDLANVTGGRLDGDGYAVKPNEPLSWPKKKKTGGDGPITKVISGNPKGAI